MRLALFFLFLPACAPTLAGQLKGADGEIVTSADARVNIVGLDGGEDGVATRVVVVLVDGGGGFSTSEELPPGEYLIEALVPGYALASKRVRLGETDAVELTLAKVAETKTEAVRASSGLGAGRGGGGATLTPPSL